MRKSIMSSISCSYNACYIILHFGDVARKTFSSIDRPFSLAEQELLSYVNCDVAVGKKSENYTDSIWWKYSVITTI